MKKKSQLYSIISETIVTEHDNNQYSEDCIIYKIKGYNVEV